MLQILVPITPEGWDEEKQEFVEPVSVTLQLEHSLVSLSKWESKYCKPFLTKTKKTAEETMDYIKYMTLTPNVDPSVYAHLTEENVKEINNYIEAPMTATTINDRNKSGGRASVVTSEVIYSWMVALNIPPEYQHWHLNRLMTLVRVCNIQNSPQKKQSRSEIQRSNAALNAARRQQLNSKG